MKLIEGELTRAGDPEAGVSRGQLMPRHKVLTLDDVSAETRRKLQDSLVLVHGGMAQNVGPILEMVTEKYLVRAHSEWLARQSMLSVLKDILAALQAGDIRAVGQATTRNFYEFIQVIIPWATNHFTETLIARVRAEFGEAFWGFWMLGGMSGGGMGFIFDPRQKAQAQARLGPLMAEIKRELQHALPFAMEPVVYDFAINENGTFADLLAGSRALMPAKYYTLTLPALLRLERKALSPTRRAELDKFGSACRTQPGLRGVVQLLFDAMVPRSKESSESEETLAALLEQLGFDRVQHEQIRADLLDGRIGLAQNRLPASAAIEDVQPSDVTHFHARDNVNRSHTERGLAALRAGELAVVTLAAGSGSRWTQGAGVVKALNPFCKLSGRHRTFVETHLAKSRKISNQVDSPIPHIFTTSYLTHAPIEEFLAQREYYRYPGRVLLSPGKAVGLRLVPTVRDLRFQWEEMPQQILDEQQQKLRESGRQALIGWARQVGEASDYTDNLPLQCLHPIGHWFEIPNLLRNGVLARLLKEQPNLQYLLLHNIDTLGADPDPALLGLHIQNDSALTFEVIQRRLEDRGGGLARVNGQVRLVEGLALPREEAEFALSYYNTNTCWIHIDKLLAAFSLNRQAILHAPPGVTSPESQVNRAIREMAFRVPTYITLKDVKRRWGQGQEDVLPVLQFEKLWVDMTSLSEVQSRFVVVSRQRGQQLKDPSQLDGWLRDGSARYVESLCAWS